MRGYAGTLALCAASCVVAGVACELVLRLVAPQKLMLNVSRWHPYVGFVNMPDFRGVGQTDEFTMMVTTNSHGLRDREFAYEKPCGVIRIGVFGDSFTFGEGVQNSEAYPKVVERLLSRKSDQHETNARVEVINFGIGKTGTSEQYAFYQIEGRRYHLDLVLVGFLARNDFDDNWAGLFRLVDGRLAYNEPAYSTSRQVQDIVYRIPFYRYLAGHSHFVNLIKRAAAVADDTRRLNAASVSVGGGTLTPEALERAYVGLTSRLIRQFRDSVVADGARFEVVNLPARGQLAACRYSGTQGEPAYLSRCARLLEELSGARIDVIDPAPMAPGKEAELHYFPKDGHMTAAGHRVVASAVAQSLTGFLNVRERSSDGTRELMAADGASANPCASAEIDPRDRRRQP